MSILRNTSPMRTIGRTVLWHKKGGIMSASDTQETSLADEGYAEAIELMAVGKLSTVRFWRREAFDLFRDALASAGEPCQEWMDTFNVDVTNVIGQYYSASFLTLDDEDYPTEAVADEQGPFAVIKLTRHSGGNLRFVVRPDADQALRPIKHMRMFP